MKTYAQYGLLIILTLFLLWRGIIPAWKEVSTDFPNYYTSSRLLLEGKDLKKNYDDNWFAEQIHKYDIDEQGKFSPFPPSTAFIMVPFAIFEPLTAKRLWTIFNIIFLVLNIALFQQVTGKSYVWSTNLIMASGNALANTLRFGQFYLILSCLITASYLLWMKTEVIPTIQNNRSTTKNILAGILLGIGTSLKYFPFVYVLVLTFKQKWKIVIASLATVIIIFLLSVSLMGIDVHRVYLHNVFFQHLNGELSGQTPYSVTYQSWNSLLRFMFVAEIYQNPAPLIEWHLGYDVARVLIFVIIVSITGWGLYRLNRYSLRNAIPLQFSLVGLTAMLLLPAFATYHFLLLTFPIALFVISINGKEFDITRWSIILLYAAIGFLPMSFLQKMDITGVQIFFAYPRLWIMTAIFTITTWTVFRLTTNTQKDQVVIN